MRNLLNIWFYLSAQPLVHLTLTLAGFQAGMQLCRKARLNPVLNTFLLAVLLIVAIFYATGTPYKTYLEGAQFVHFLLGPATVALYRQFDKVRRWALAVISSIITRTLTAAASALAIAWVLGASRKTLISLTPKSVTAPVAMGITERRGRLPSLTAVLVIVTGILGAMLGPPLLNLLGITSGAARGLAIGTASHDIGTARALQVNEIAGAFSGLPMGLNALATGILLPLLHRLFF